LPQIGTDFALDDLPSASNPSTENSSFQDEHSLRREISEQNNLPLYPTPAIEELAALPPPLTELSKPLLNPLIIPDNAFSNNEYAVIDEEPLTPYPVVRTNSEDIFDSLHATATGFICEDGCPIHLASLSESPRMSTSENNTEPEAKCVDIEMAVSSDAMSTPPCLDMRALELPAENLTQMSAEAERQFLHEAEQRAYARMCVRFEQMRWKYQWEVASAAAALAAAKKFLAC
jgi:hypothetical protein